MRLVADMRAAQKRYFRDRTQSALQQSKWLEKEVDRWIEGLTVYGPVEDWSELAE